MEIEKYIEADDAQLASFAVEGDQKALEHLLNRYRDSIRQIYIQRTRGNGEDVDDLIQEVFIKVWLNLYRYDPTYSFRQWVFTIARNTFIDFVRRKRDDLSIDAVGKEEVRIAPVSPVPNPEESIIRSQQKVMIERCLNQMPPAYRLLIDYRFFREYSYEEIAGELSIPLGTVKTRIHRARNILCKLIEEQSDF